MESIDHLIDCIASSTDLQEEASGSIKQQLIANAIESQRQAIKQKDEEKHPKTTVKEHRPVKRK